MSAHLEYIKEMGFFPGDEIEVVQNIEGKDETDDGYGLIRTDDTIIGEVGEILYIGKNYILHTIYSDPGEKYYSKSYELKKI